MEAPKIPYAMYEALKARSLDYLVPNLNLIRNNTVVLMQENRKFIEAFMVGLNHEMCRELVWREYPTDSKGTIFSYFWEPIGSQPSEGDIKQIAKWDRPLSGNGLKRDGLQDRTIFAIKADLIRRYPDVEFYAIMIVDTQSGESKIDWQKFFNNYDENGKAPIGFNLIDPEIEARVGEDTLFLGYPIPPKEIYQNPENYYFVISQAPSLPRFGLDSKKNPALNSINDLSWADFSVGQGGWIDPCQKYFGFSDDAIWDGKNDSNTSAIIAQFTLQLPVRLVVPANKLVKIE